MSYCGQPGDWSDEWIECIARYHTDPQNHQLGTTAIGYVVDEELRVKGIKSESSYYSYISLFVMIFKYENHKKNLRCNRLKACLCKLAINVRNECRTMLSIRHVTVERVKRSSRNAS